MLESVAVRRRQCVISTAAVGSSAAAMFPLFITHDEYFVRCGGSEGGGTTMFLICPATNFLLDGVSVAAARWRQRGGGGQHGSGVGSVVVMAAERWQRGSGSAAAAVWGYWPRGGSAVAGSMAAVSASAAAAQC